MICQLCLTEPQSCAEYGGNRNLTRPDYWYVVPASKQHQTLTSDSSEMKYSEFNTCYNSLRMNKINFC